MLDLKTIDELTRRLGESLPPGVRQARDELEERVRTVLTSAFERMNLVGREEFADKCAQLEEARTRLQELESRLDQLQTD